MKRLRQIEGVAALLGVLAVAFPAAAAGPYDGVWVVDVPGSTTSGTFGGGQACPALRFPIEIKDNQVSGSLERVGTNNVVEQGYDRNARPVAGTVAPDGTVTGEWLNYHAEGKLDGNGQGTVSIKGSCGPRQATLVRVK